MPEALLRLEQVTKSYGTEVITQVLHGVDLTIERGEFMAIIGRSGSGKSTLLNQIGLLDRPSSGRIWVEGRPTERMIDAELTTLRNRTLGFIFQFHHLLGALSAEENLMLPLGIREGRLSSQQRALARSALDAVGLSHRATAKPDTLSGGEQQRVAIARALVHRPQLVLADEPTGNLDSKTADDVFGLLRRFNAELGLSFVLVTHDTRLARSCDRVVRIDDGRIRADGTPDEVLGERDAASAPLTSGEV